MSKYNFKLRPPVATDGMSIHRLVARCKPLDENSNYCNLLQASHFADTAVAAFLNDALVGFVSGYRKPDEAQAWFVWQVAVDQAARGHGLAKQMLRSVLERAHTSRIEYIETTITADNDASWALFQSLASQLNAPLGKKVLFDQKEHFDGQHSTEYLVRIGPF